jgi:hypothetical protein
MFRDHDEWLVTGEDVSTQRQYGDHSKFSPAAVLNTRRPCRRGSPTSATCHRSLGGWPPWNDGVERFCRTVQALGMISAKRDLLVVENYHDHGVQGRFYEVANILRWALLMRHVTDLCAVAERSSMARSGLGDD